MNTSYYTRIQINTHIQPREKHHREIALLNQKERDRQRMDIISANQSDYSQPNMNDNHNRNNIPSQGNDSYDSSDEEFAILQELRRQRIPCTDHLESWLSWYYVVLLIRLCIYVMT